MQFDAPRCPVFLKPCAERLLAERGRNGRLAVVVVTKLVGQERLGVSLQSSHQLALAMLLAGFGVGAECPADEPPVGCSLLDSATSTARHVIDSKRVRSGRCGGCH